MVNNQVTLVNEVLHLKLDLLRVNNNSVMAEGGETLSD
jgi:hypothetical protein